MSPVKSINPIGLAVRSIEAQRPYYEDVPDQKVRIAFFQIGEMRLELVEPTDPVSPVALFLV